MRKTSFLLNKQHAKKYKIAKLHGGFRASATCCCLSCFRKNRSPEKILGILHNPAFLHGCLFNLQSIIAGKRKTHNHKSGLEFIERFSKCKSIINSEDTL